jgi:NtrC-family two-component system response regulator AlgB
VFARWMRAHSRRPDAPFVTVHCPLLSTELMSSILFGHRRGAFTGAVTDSVGKVEEAEGGTLFLDEIGDLGMDAQTRLLRFLNDRTYERLGEARERKADVRLIAATNRPLEEEVRTGRLREDLLFRLNVISLTLPPLRERLEDVMPMARHYLRTFERLQGRQHLAFSTRCEQAIAAYPWPGNLRQLRNAVERAVILSPANLLEAVDLGLSAGDPSDPFRTEVALGADVSLEVIEREHIARVVMHSPSFEAAARTLGIDVTTLQRKRKRYGMS